MKEKLRLERTSGDQLVQPSVGNRALPGYAGPCQAQSFTPSPDNLFQNFTVLMVKNCSMETEFPLKQPEPVAFCSVPVHPHEDSYLLLLYSYLSGRLRLDSIPQNIPLSMFNKPGSISLQC